jgi:hypothetical protein
LKADATLWFNLTEESEPDIFRAIKKEPF